MSWYVLPQFIFCAISYPQRLKSMMFLRFQVSSLVFQKVVSVCERIHTIFIGRSSMRACTDSLRVCRVHLLLISTWTRALCNVRCVFNKTNNCCHYKGMLEDLPVNARLSVKSTFSGREARWAVAIHLLTSLSLTSPLRSHSEHTSTERESVSQSRYYFVSFIHHCNHDSWK